MFTLTSTRHYFLSVNHITDTHIYTLSLHDALPIYEFIGSTTLTVANGFTNNGSIQLTDVHSGNSQTATLNVSSGRLEKDTTEHVPADTLGAGRLRELKTELNNQGTINVGASLTINQ